MFTEMALLQNEEYVCPVLWLQDEAGKQVSGRVVPTLESVP